jgi:hypothetical protein
LQICASPCVLLYVLTFRLDILHFCVTWYILFWLLYIIRTFAENVTKKREIIPSFCTMNISFTLSQRVL